METYFFETKGPLYNNDDVLIYFIDNENTELDIYLEDVAYAEGEDSEGVCWEIHSSGDGDDFNHRVEFIRIDSY